MTRIHPAVLLMLALALLLLGLAVWLFGRARRQQQLQSVSSHLQRSIHQRAMATPAGGARVAQQPVPGPGLGPSMPRGSATGAPAGWQARLTEVLGLGAWGISSTTVLLLAAVGLAVLIIGAALAGPTAAILLTAIHALVTGFFIWRRASARRQRLLQQLPGFLDNMVRLISIGNSPHAAFQLAVGNVPAPLGDALQQATAMLSANPDLGQAMAQLEGHWRLPEFGLLAAVFRMSVRYGGRADLVLERVAAYIRDRQAAEQELHALSAEIRLSAWVLALLPIAVGALIMVLNAGYFLRMWNDPSGQKMILVAAALEAFGAFLLYRLARLK
ncbi:secretion system protein [Corticibacter populi]|uniref:Secretion system protein n=1 Tax=Corticibacter populi TaxID=1550736 RepID=A0A3M6QTG1_9BURK|nr:type II secretion system F family protein [Corticibacter populi]RMX06316.1 secretion system protein [Corticibacter populi]RZS32148.1 tight adherence protein B [Corticibacter populi]